MSSSPSEPNSNISELYQNLLSISNGARFFKCDLHVHTPASKDYRENRRNDDSVEDTRYIDILKKASELGLDLVAVTDHNSVEGYRKLRELLHTKAMRDQFSDIAVLFGVEITVEAGRYVHLTAFFDERTPLQDVEHLLIRIGIDKPGDEHDWAKSVKLDQLIKMISDLGGLAIPAHVDSTAGILEEMKHGLPLARILTMPEVIAVGITKTKTVEYLGKLLKDYSRSEPMAYITGSDAHALSRMESIGKNGQVELVDRGLGSLITYIKMDKPNFASFKYAIQDPATRINLVPPQTAHHPRILGLAIHGGYLGKGEDWNYFHFNDELNCIVGGRGTGKSTILKVITTLSLALSGVQPNDWYRELEYAFHRACLFVDIGHDQVWAVSATTQPPSVVVLRLHDSGGFIPGELTNAQDWTPSLFGQKQIQTITSSLSAQRDLLDSFCERSIPDRSVNALHVLLQLKQQIDNLFAITRKDATSIGNAKHKIFLANRLFRRVRKLSSGVISDVISEIDNWKTESEVINFVRTLLKEGSSAEVQELLDTLRIARRQIGAGVMQGKAIIPEEETQRYLSTLQRLARITPLDKLCFEQRQLNSKAITDGFLSLYEHMKANKQLLADLREARSEVYRIRKSVADSLSDQLGGKVKVDILEMGDSSFWVSYIVEKITSPSVRESIASEMPNEVIKQLGTPYEALLAALQEHHPFDKLAEPLPNYAKDQFLTALLRDMSGAFFKKLHDSERDIDDVVQIYLTDQGVSKPLGHLSLGQRCVAILDLVLLTQSSVPVVIDQPEDDLDNSYVFTELVQTLRKAKEHRQLILVTHNPNLLFGGDADQVFVMRSDGVQAWIADSGAVDNIVVRQHLLRTLEGGRQAFELRRTRYHAIESQGVE
jgi:ABC-type cobalamin/Fe3+-siderophores transport system ATPase subunit